MGRWLSARKGGAGIYVEFGHGFSNNLTAHQSRVWSEGPDLHIRIDLNPNLRGRCKETGTYLDARDLADAPERLTLVQLDDEALLKVIDRVLSGITGAVPRFLLTVDLEGEHCYLVEPKVISQHMYTSLALTVQELLAST